MLDLPDSRAPPIQTLCAEHLNTRYRKERHAGLKSLSQPNARRSS